MYQLHESVVCIVLHRLSIPHQITDGICIVCLNYFNEYLFIEGA